MSRGPATPGRAARATHAAALGLAATLASSAPAPALAAAPPPASPAPIRFTDVTKKAGIRFRYDCDLRRGKTIATMGGGVAMGDYDGDGHLDLFFSGSVANGKKPGKGPFGVLYRNRGDGTFEDATAKAGIRSWGWMSGAAFVDLDGTGLPDLVVTGLGKLELWKNRGDGTFREEAAARGLAAPLWGVGLAAADVDGDGRVDLYLVNYLDTDYEKELAMPTFELRMPDDYAGQDAALYVQGPDGRFTERAAAAGVTNAGGRGLQAVLFDADGDGKADLYVTNDRTSNKLHRGRGDGTFEDVTVEAGAGSRELRQPRAGMGIAAGDADGDGHPDLLVTNFAGEPVTFYRSVEGQLFDDATASAGFEGPTFPYVQWGTDFVDLDDDGFRDVPIVSGHLVPRWIMFFASLFRKGGMGLYGGGDKSYKQPPVLMRNAGDGRFAEVTAGSGLDRLRLAARGLAAGDVDGDGRVDLAIGALAGGVRLMHNATASPGHVLEVLPVAGSDHRTVLGTKLVVHAGGRRQVAEFTLRPSYASEAWVPLHFGLGDAARVERLEVVPPGATAPAFVLEDVAADRLYRLQDGKLTEVRRFPGRLPAAPEDRR